MASLIISIAVDPESKETSLTTNAQDVLDIALLQYALLDAQALLHQKLNDFVTEAHELTTAVKENK